jgi:dTDP-4-amino-4,6-dideoxygalactose transaminase
VGEVSRLEEDFAAFTGAKYCVAVASGGYAMSCALRAIGVGSWRQGPVERFHACPGAGRDCQRRGEPVFVETTEALTIDIDDLADKARQAARDVLLLSHMRGHICDMDRLMQVCDSLGLRVIEDCAHTMGAEWNGTPSGRHGLVACYSTQTYKHINSGEGGLITSDDPDVMARAIVLSGSYMLLGDTPRDPLWIRSKM